MFSNHMFGLLYDARREWREISREPEETITQVYVKHALLLAMIPPFALFTGTTQMGWSFAGQDLVFLSIGSRHCGSFLHQSVAWAGSDVVYYSLA